MSEEVRSPSEESGPGPSFVRQFLESQTGLEGDAIKQLNISENYWKAMKRKRPGAKGKGAPVVVRRIEGVAPSDPMISSDPLDFDVCVCGGNLGICIALALQNRGHRVLIVERRLLRGRTQEWNASRKEMRNFLKTGLLTERDIEEVIVSEFNPNRVSFKGGENVWVRDILNIGVAPDRLIRKLKQRFLAQGGVVRELCEFRSAAIYDDMAVLKLKSNVRVTKPAAQAQREKAQGQGLARPPGGIPGDALPRDSVDDVETGELDITDANKPNAVPTLLSFDEDEDDPPIADPLGKEVVTCALLVDCMGHFSPIVRQLRNGAKPESIVFVVGGCIEAGVPRFSHSDILSSFTDAERDMQCFWEVFPARDGTTVYMFTYCDADESRMSFEDFLGSFLKWLPQFCEEGVRAEEEIAAQGRLEPQPGAPPGPATCAALDEGAEAFLDGVQFKRLLMAAFPSYKKAPLQTPFDRLVLVGDSSSVQSPLSFGGFGAMLRHLPRLDEALHEAVSGGHLTTKDLQAVQPYMPSLSAAWLFQRAMGFEPRQMGYEKGYGVLPESRAWTKEHINRVLKTNFGAMSKMDDSVLLPFLQVCPHGMNPSPMHTTCHRAMRPSTHTHARIRTHMPSTPTTFPSPPFPSFPLSPPSLSLRNTNRSCTSN